MNGANPQLSSPLCLIDGDGFGSAFVGEKCSFCYCVKEPDDRRSLHAVHAHTRTRLLLFRLQGKKMAAISLAESRIVSYVACFSSNSSFLPVGERGSIGQRCLTTAELET